MALIGLIGGPLCFLSGVGVLFGLYDDVSAIKFLLTLPEIVWEASLGIYLTVKGFRPAPGFVHDASVDQGSLRPAVAAQ